MVGRCFTLVLAALLVPGLASAQEDGPGAGPPTPERRAEAQDEAIRQAIDLAIARDIGAAAKGLQVVVREGAVVLSGSVESLLIERRALELAESTRGVRSVEEAVTIAPEDPPSDAELTEWIRAALAADPATAGQDREYRVHEGVVSVAGAFADVREKHLVFCTIAALRGVRDVKDESRLAAAAPTSDADLREAVERRLKDDVHFVGREQVRVEVARGVVTLEGTLPSVRARSLAIDAALGAGATSVDADALTVEPVATFGGGPPQGLGRGAPRDAEGRTLPAAAPRGGVADDGLRTTIEGALEQHPRLSRSQVEARVERGRVTLEGVVESHAAKREAEEAVWDLAGVRGVQNLLIVSTSERVDDEDIQKSLEGAFARHALLARRGIDVEVQDGRVTLDGEVASGWERSLASDWAGKVKGVTDVENDLDVSAEGGALRTDDEIEEAIERQLFWSPFVSGGDITVTVENGVATLTGQVASWSEVSAATENALDGGARRVINELTVRD